MCKTILTKKIIIMNEFMYVVHVKAGCCYIIATCNSREAEKG